MGQTETFTYDANGLITTRTDRNGTHFRNTHDHMGRLVREEAVRNGVVTDFRQYQFNSTGALHREYNGSHMILYFYDAQGRMVRQEETGGVVNHFVYNNANNRTESWITVNGITHLRNEYLYDIAGRVHVVTSNDAVLVWYTYNANGLRVARDYGSITSTQYTFNLAGLATNVTNRYGPYILSSFDYTYYLDGNIQRVVENMAGEGGTETRTITYTYDPARRLIREEESSNIPVVVPTPTEVVSSWEELRNAVTIAPEGRPTTIYVSQSFDTSNGQAITIPSNRNITIVSTLTPGIYGERILRQPTENEFHFIVDGTLTLDRNITLCGCFDPTGISGGVLIRADGTFVMNEGRKRNRKCSHSNRQLCGCA